MGNNPSSLYGHSQQPQPTPQDYKSQDEIEEQEYVHHLLWEKQHNAYLRTPEKINERLDEIERKIDYLQKQG